MPIVSFLHDTHVMILMTDTHSQKTLTRIFSSMGATVHSARSQAEAIGLYWHLFRAGIRPRVVVTSWSLTPKDSKEYKYLEMLGRADIDGTSLNLLLNIVDLDPSAFLTVYTQDPVQATEVLVRSGVSAEVFDRNQMSPAQFVARIATHPGISDQRMACDEVHQEIAKNETERREKHKSSCELTPLWSKVRVG